MPRGAKKSQRGAKSPQDLGVIERTELIITTFNLCCRLNGGSKVKPIERRSRSAYCFAIERRSRLQGSLRYCGCEQSNGGVGRQDRTEEPVGNQGNQGIAIGRTSRSAIKGVSRVLSAATDRTDASVGVCYKVEREKLGGCAFATTDCACATTDRGGSTADS
jgi:hypothetical protein